MTVSMNWVYTLHHGATDFQHWIRHIPSIRGGARLFRVCRRSSSLLLSLSSRKKKDFSNCSFCATLSHSPLLGHITLAEITRTCIRRLISQRRVSPVDGVLIWSSFFPPPPLPFFFFKAFWLLRPRRSVPIKHHHTLAGYASATQWPLPQRAAGLREWPGVRSAVCKVRLQYYASTAVKVGRVEKSFVIFYLAHIYIYHRIRSFPMPIA